MSYYAFLRNSTYWRYGIFVLTLFLGVYTIQAWINYKSIQDTIIQTRQDTEQIQEEIDFMEKRYKNYLKSDYSAYFLGHENGQLYIGERIVAVEYWKPNIDLPIVPVVPTTTTTDSDQLVLRTPEESRHHFIREKLAPLKTLGIIK